MAMSNSKRGVAPVIIPRKIAEWIKNNTTNPKVNNFKVGGGLTPWNGRK